jgi:hypothetical protein
MHRPHHVNAGFKNYVSKIDPGASRAGGSELKKKLCFLTILCELPK